MIRCIFFDVDDTLMDYRSAERQVLTRLMREQGAEPDEAALDNLWERSWFYWEKVIAYLKSMEMDDQILLKCGVEEDYLRQLADSKSGLMYMPIVRTMEEWEKVTEYDINVSAAELIFKDVSEPLADRKFLADLGERGIFPWVNAITLNDRDILSGGLDDNGAIGEGFDENWGVLLDMGFKILQTDWPALLRNYVNQKYHL